MRTGNLGEVSRGATHFKAEVRGLAHELQQPKGRVIQFACDADLGDQRCTVDLDLPAFKGTGAVTAVADQRTFTVSGLDTFDEDWFTRGLLTWTGGANAGRKAEAKLHSKRDGVATLELWQAMAEEVEAGDAFTITAGCDKHFKTCKAKFDNSVNFRGLRHAPGHQRGGCRGRRRPLVDGSRPSRRTKLPALGIGGAGDREKFPAAGQYHLPDGAVAYGRTDHSCEPLRSGRPVFL